MTDWWAYYELKHERDEVALEEAKQKAKEDAEQATQEAGNG